MSADGRPELRLLDDDDEVSVLLRRLADAIDAGDDEAAAELLARFMGIARGTDENE